MCVCREKVSRLNDDKRDDGDEGSRMAEKRRRKTPVYWIRPSNSDGFMY